LEELRRQPLEGRRLLDVGGGIGVISAELADEIGLPADYGLLIVQVTPGGSAERAGLHGGTERAYRQPIGEPHYKPAPRAGSPRRLPIVS